MHILDNCPSKKQPLFMIQHNEINKIFQKQRICSVITLIIVQVPAFLERFQQETSKGKENTLARFKPPVDDKLQIRLINSVHNLS